MAMKLYGSGSQEWPANNRQNKSWVIFKKKKKYEEVEEEEKEKEM